MYHLTVRVIQLKPDQELFGPFTISIEAHIHWVTIYWMSF